MSFHVTSHDVSGSWPCNTKHPAFLYIISSFILYKSLIGCPFPQVPARPHPPICTTFALSRGRVLQLCKWANINESGRQAIYITTTSRIFSVHLLWNKRRGLHPRIHMRVYGLRERWAVRKVCWWTDGWASDDQGETWLLGEMFLNNHGVYIWAYAYICLWIYGWMNWWMHIPEWKKSAVWEMYFYINNVAST